MSTKNVVNAALFSKLSGGTALITLLGGTSIYSQQAPDGKAPPYVVFSQQAGGPMNINPSDLRGLLYFVRGFASTGMAAGSIDAACSTLLHKQALTVSGYTHVWTQREEEFETIEVTPSGDKIFMAGAFYRIELDG